MTLRFALSWETVEYLILVSLLFCISCADLYDYIIPNRLIAAGIVCRTVFVLLGGDVPMTALRALVGGVSISLPVLLLVLAAEKIMKKEAMGGGDIKLLGMIGAFFGWPGVLFTVLTASLIGTAVGGVVMWRSRKGLDTKLPFGPFLAGGALLYLFWGDAFFRWYVTDILGF